MNYQLEDLTNFEKNILIQWFMYHLEYSDRMELIENFPKIYSKLTGIKKFIREEKES